VAVTTDDPAFVDCLASPVAHQGYDLRPPSAVPFNTSTARATTWRLRAVGLAEGVLYRVACTVKDERNQSRVHTFDDTRTVDLTPPCLLRLELVARVTGVAATVALSEPGRVTCRALAVTRVSADPASIDSLLGPPSSSASRVASLVVPQAQGNYTLELGGLEPAKNFSIACYATDRSVGPHRPK
jgi:hypothetical protein